MLRIAARGNVSWCTISLRTYSKNKEKPRNYYLHEKTEVNKKSLPHLMYPDMRKDFASVEKFLDDELPVGKLPSNVKGKGSVDQILQSELGDELSEILGIFI